MVPLMRRGTHRKGKGKGSHAHAAGDLCATRPVQLIGLLLLQYGASSTELYVLIYVCTALSTCQTRNAPRLFSSNVDCSCPEGLLTLLAEYSLLVRGVAGVRRKHWTTDRLS